MPTLAAAMKPAQVRVLLAEDDKVLRDLVRISLEAAGYEIISVANGEEALARFAQEPLDLVILNVLMPKLDGFQVCEEIRKRSDAPIMIMTALNSPEHVVRGFDLGADGFLAKPFTIRELRARVQAILRRMS